MNVTITARHCEIPDSLRGVTERHMHRLGRYNPKLADADVTFDRERLEHAVEIRLAVPGQPALIARGSGATFKSALDRGVHRASRQLRRARERTLQASPGIPA